MRRGSCFEHMPASSNSCIQHTDVQLPAVSKGDGFLHASQLACRLPHVPRSFVRKIVATSNGRAIRCPRAVTEDMLCKVMDTTKKAFAPTADVLWNPFILSSAAAPLMMLPLQVPAHDGQHVFGTKADSAILGNQPIWQNKWHAFQSELERVQHYMTIFLG